MTGLETGGRSPDAVFYVLRRIRRLRDLARSKAHPVLGFLEEFLQLLLGHPGADAPQLRQLGYATLTRVEEHGNPFASRIVNLTE